MKAARFNRHIAKGRQAAEGNLPALERGYRITLQSAARHAGDRFAALATDHLTADATDPKWTPPQDEQLFDLDALAADAQKRTKAAHQASVKAVMAPALADVGLSYDLTNPLVAGLVDSLGVRAADMGDAVRGDVARSVLDSYQKGLSVIDAAKAIQAAVEEIAPVRAAMLARTDLVGLANGASVAAAQIVMGADTGGEGALGYKRWLATEDERTREAHAEADGQIVPLAQPFDVGGEHLLYPGDPNGSSDEVINCRCTVTYLDAAEAVAETGDAPLAIAADGGPDVSNLAMVAVYPRASEAEALAVAGGHAPDDLHCTLLFLGEADGLNEAMLRGTIAAVARSLPPIGGMVGGVAHFAEGPDGYPSILLPDVKGLSTLQETVRAALDSAGIVSTSEHGFTPHMTLAYSDQPQVPDAEKLSAELHYDALSVVIGGNRVDYPLTGALVSAGQMDTSPDAPLTADVTITVGDEAATETSAAPTRWRAVLCVEGEPTEDGRMLEYGSITWRELPLSLGVMFETPHSDGASAEIGGRIDRIWRDGNLIMGEGVFSGDECGQRAASMVADLTLRGISVDLGVIAYELREADPPVATDETDDTPDAEQDIADVITEIDNLIFVITEGVIGAATVCPYQAIAGATIAIIASGDQDTATIAHNTCFVLTVEQPAVMTELVADGWVPKIDELAARVEEIAAGFATAERARVDDSRTMTALVAAAVEEATVPKKLLTDIGQSLTALSEEISRKPRTVQFERDGDGKLAGLREG